MTLTFDEIFWVSNLASFYHSTPCCQSSSKSVNNFLRYSGNGLNSFFDYRLFDPCDLDLWPIFLAFELSLTFIILPHPAKAPQNRSIPFWVIVVTRFVWQTDTQTDRQTNTSKNITSYHFVMEVINNVWNIEKKKTQLQKRSMHGCFSFRIWRKSIF